jgi:hypothetical protein
MLTKIVSGGQTGVDRAALDIALERGLSCGGWCPPGRAAEDGRIPDRYPLAETPADTSPEAPAVPHSLRTEWNVRDSDGTLVLVMGQAASRSSGPNSISRDAPPVLTAGPADRGTALTLRVAERLGKPHLQLDLTAAPSAAAVRDWAEAHNVHVLNVAGPRESSSPGIGERARLFLRELLA